MDVIELLIGDHNRVRGLIARYEEASEGSDEKTAISLGQSIVRELRTHIDVEEEVFYPVVHEISETLSEGVDEGYEEHHVVEVLMDEMDGLEPGSDQWNAKMTVVIESTEHHLDEEESEMFPKVRSNTDIGRREALGTAFEEKKVALGVPTLADTMPMSKEELVEKAREQQIPGRSTMDHDELAATVSPV